MKETYIMIFAAIALLTSIMFGICSQKIYNLQHEAVIKGYATYTTNHEWQWKSNTTKIATNSINKFERKN